MQLRYYIDTSIWMDLYEGRNGYNNEPLGEYAFKLFSNIKLKGGRIVISYFLLQELNRYYTSDEINSMLMPFLGIIDNIPISQTQYEQARIIADERGIPKGDVLHAIVARDNNFILITRDNHFRNLRDISQSYAPEELI